MQTNMPPELYLMQVLRNCPKAGLLYVELWKLRNIEGIVLVEKRRVPTNFLTTMARFREHLIALVREGLANIEETHSHMIIEMVAWDDVDIDASGFTLC